MCQHISACSAYSQIGLRLPVLLKEGLCVDFEDDDVDNGDGGTGDGDIVSDCNGNDNDDLEVSHAVLNGDDIDDVDNDDDSFP